MRFLSVCSGIEAASVAWKPLGWRPYLLSEIEAFPREVLKARHDARDVRKPYYSVAWTPSPALWGDFTSIRERYLRRIGRTLAAVDLLCGGTPCQSFSVAGLRRSLGDDRGNLSLAFVRLADAIDAVRLRAGKPAAWIVWENVPGVLSTADNAFGAIMGGLVGGDAAVEPPRGGWPDAGVVAGPVRCAAWRVLDAQFFGLAQRRRRIIVIARGYFGDVGRWDGPDALLPVTARSGWHPAPRREARQSPAGTLSARTQGGGGLGTDFDLDGGLIAHALRAEGFDASEDGTGRGTPLVPVAATLTRGAESHGKGGYSGRRQEDEVNLVAHTLNAKGGGGRIDAESETFVAGTLVGNGKAAGSATNQDAESGMLVPVGISQGMAVRRLTPMECERLQGFPDGYTDIPFRGRPAKDGPRYKALGNSWAVPKMRWVGERIAAVDAARAERVAA
jgi:DNA (cytosine-5)-methyltransferase 1